MPKVVPIAPAPASAGSKEPPSSLTRTDASMERKPSKVEIARMGEKLAEGRRSFLRRRLCVTYTFGTFGTVLMIVCAVVLWMPRQGSFGIVVGGLAGVVGGLCLLLAILPTDVCGVQFLQSLGLLMTVLVTLLWVSNAMKLISLPTGECQYSATEPQPLPRWFCRWTLAFWAVSILLIGLPAMGIFLRSLLRLPPRAALESAWRTLGLYCFAMAFFRVVDFPIAVHAGRHLSTEMVIIKVVEIVVMVASGALMCSGLRGRIQAMMQAAGAKQLSTAAGIAAMMGNKSSESVKSVASQNFFGISLDKLNSERLATNAPDPTLFELAEQAQLGQVDFFVSHSWRDDPKAKWKVLQSVRIAFVAEHGREPLFWYA